MRWSAASGVEPLLNFYRMEKDRYTKLKVYLTDIRPNDTPNALRHTVNSVTEARCGFLGVRLMPPTPEEGRGGTGGGGYQKACHSL